MFKIINKFKVYSFDTWTEASDFKRENGGTMYCLVYSCKY
jgi:hypothetical protein